MTVAVAMAVVVVISMPQTTVLRVAVQALQRAVLQGSVLHGALITIVARAVVVVRWVTRAGNAQ